MTNLGRIREEELLEETNPLAIVPDNNPIGPSTSSLPDNSSNSTTSRVEEASVHRVKKEEVESKIAAWQTAEIAKINNRFKREDVIINGWESEQVEKTTACLKKVEVMVSTHPLIKHWSFVLRNEQTSSIIFENALAKLGRLVIYEASRDWLYKLCS